jgi:outer membrane murein-binding lipoprotein Lpp
MIKLLKVSAVALGVSLMAGCAATSDLADLQSNYDQLQADLNTVKAQTAAVSTKADQAARDASAAAANAAAATAAAINNRLFYVGIKLPYCPQAITTL